jgi:hypothetical protein
VAEGEAQRYFDHALTLRDTILFLRYNKNLGEDKCTVPAMALGQSHITIIHGYTVCISLSMWSILF